MHSRVFKGFLFREDEDIRKKLKEEEARYFIEENHEDYLYEIMQHIGADYVSRNLSNLEGDIDWLISSTLEETDEKKVKRIIDKIRQDFDGVDIYVIKGKHYNMLKKGLNKDIDKRIEKIKMLLENIKPKNKVYTMYSIKEAAYPSYDFAFLIYQYGFLNNTLELFNEMQKNSVLVIVDSYDYHF